MRLIYLTVLLVAFALANGATHKLQRKDLLGGLLGGDGLLGDDGLVNDLLGGDGLLGGVLGDDGILGDLIDSILGPNGLVGSLLGRILGPDVVGSLLSDAGINSLLQSVDKIVQTVFNVVDELLKDVLAALQGVIPSNTSEVIKKFDTIACNKLCPVCQALPQVELRPVCTNYCKSTCRWLFG
ncbi:uncharacterized protein LOC131941814 [Physella acuta]|uniref:uncharacterized protein LOC131941814 n=1 Tax=Physella acuta TaxID=109671 RepID=UPI0027DB1935|nr:uncharacterized protein LOC131941814 [Physella acuta]